MLLLGAGESGKSTLVKVSISARSFVASAVQMGEASGRGERASGELTRASFSTTANAVDVSVHCAGSYGLLSTRRAPS